MAGNTRIFFVSAAYAALSICAADLWGAPKVSNVPELAGKSVVFVERKQFPQDHHNTANIFQLGEINEGAWNVCAGNSAMYKADFDSSGNLAAIRKLVSSKDGIVRDPEISFDAKKIVFSMRENLGDSYGIYELDLPSGKFVRLTRVAEACDIDPAYLGDGSIVFASTRAAKYCGCNRHIMCNLYKMDPDGANIVQIGNSIEFEHMPHVLRDGRILYTRWEYVDRNFSGAQGLWTCNPDGTAHALYWGQETKQPCLNAVQMPESTTVAAILGSCHNIAWGALAVIDRKIDVEGEKSVVKIFPPEARKLIDKPGDVFADSMNALKIKYEDPEPVSEKLVLVSRTLSEGTRKMGLFLVDVDSGAEKLVVESDGELGIFDAKVVSKRPLPQSSAERRSWERGAKSFVYVGDVYEGTHMKGVKRGDIKWLRVVQDHFKLTFSPGWWENEGSQAPAMNFDDYDRKEPLGVVPVRDDGSAFFEVPSDKFVYLQALDKNGDMVQTMRSGFVALPGEIVSCAGCHESRFSPPPVSGHPFKNGKPDKIDASSLPAAGECFSYMKSVQPIFDKHCIGCHDVGGKGAAKLVLAGDRGLVFNRSYLELHSKKYVKAIGAGPDKVQEANTWGAKQSPIVAKIRSGHGGKLSAEEFEVLRLWIDLNAPYYSTEDCAYPENPTGRSPLAADEIIKLFEICGKPSPVKKDPKWVGKRILARDYKFEEVSFDRPEKSPILAGLDPGNHEYAKALEIIKTGAERLRNKPRADMAGFEESSISKARRERFRRFVELEKSARRARAEGGKLKDPKSIMGAQQH